MVRKLIVGKLTSLVDDSDWELVSQHDWHLSDKGYARTFINGKPIRLHRYLLGLTDSTIQVDHINRDKLDNRRCNLRTCESKHNNYNTVHKSSSYRGVSFDKQKNKWKATISFEKAKIHLGKFKYKKVAALTYDVACVILHREFGVLNFRLRKSEIAYELSKRSVDFLRYGGKLSKEDEETLRMICQSVVKSMLNSMLEG